MPNRRVTLIPPRYHESPCSMDATTLSPSILRVRRRDVAVRLAQRVASVAWHARAVVRARRLTAEAGGRLHVDPALRVDPSVIDDDEWLAWGKRNLSQLEYERRVRAVDADRAAQRVRVS